MRPFVALALLVVGSTLAGCLSDLAEGDGPDEAAGERLTFRADWAEHALPYSDHDHHDAAQHQGLSTPNFKELGWDPLLTDYYGRSAGGYLCGDSVDTGERRLAAVHGYGTDVAFVLVDVTDGSAPKVVGEFIMPRAASRDVAITPDGNHVAIAVSTPDPGPTPTSAVPGLAAGEAYFRASCDGEPRPVRWSPEALAGRASALAGAGPEQEAPFPPGAMLVSIRDPADIFVESYYPLPVLGAHSIYAGELEGRTIVIASVVNLAASASNFWFFQVVEGANPLQLLSLFQDRPDGGGLALVNGHNDGVVQKHPVTGRPLAYLANWHQGMIILDMTDPRRPTVHGRWSDNAGPSADLVQDGSGDVHEAIPLDTTWGGRHYTFVGQEILDHPTATPSGLIHILDTTDPANPVKVAEWTLPVDVVWDASAVFSTHYVQFVGSTLFVSHYHAGVWAVDLSGLLDGAVDEADRHPPAIGVYIPARVSPKPPPDASYDWTPTIMDVNPLRNGDLVVWDNRSGVYTVRFDATQPAPPRVFEGYN
jgi:hypothetical protein